MNYHVENISVFISRTELNNGSKAIVKKQFVATVRVSKEISVEVELSKELIEQIEHEASVKASILISKEYIREADEHQKKSSSQGNTDLQAQ